MARDLVFLHMGKFLHKIVIVFIHGWYMRYAENVNRRVVSRLNNAGCLIVLAEEFKKSLIGMGLTIPIYIMTTKVDDRLLQNFDINKRTGEINTLLFLASVQRKKGIFTLIGAYGVLKRKYANLCLNIVGDGTALNEAIDYVADNDIQGVLFTGRLDGQELADQFVKSDIYILPTHGEGMPASVLEAMAFGLPVITRPVGGLVDFFTPSMGSLVESLNPGDYVSEIERYITNPRLTKSISIYNYQFAKENFLASSVARKFENIFAILNGNRNS
jgi:glycosyltransferase involved in cell wall biosynthesis